MASMNLYGFMSEHSVRDMTTTIRHRKTTKEMTLDLPEGERGITEEETETKEQQIKNTMLAQMDSKLDLILAYQEAALE